MNADELWETTMDPDQPPYAARARLQLQPNYPSSVPGWTSRSSPPSPGAHSFTHLPMSGRPYVRSDSLLGAISRSSQALATQIPNRLAERLRVGNLPSG